MVWESLEGDPKALRSTLSNDEEIYTMSDQERPSKSEGVGIRESDSTARANGKGAPIALLDPRKLTVDEMVDNVMRALVKARKSR